jgi:hypothetical protein
MIIQVQFWCWVHQDPSALSGLKNKQTAQGGQGADPDVESGFKELIKC